MEIMRERLKELRAELSQQDVVDAINARHSDRENDISREAIRNWENGTRKPKIENLVELADFYNTTVDWILGREGAARSRDPELQMVMDSTGLSERAIRNLQDLKRNDQQQGRLSELLSSFLENSFFYGMIAESRRYIDLRLTKENMSVQGTGEYGAIEKKIKEWGYFIGKPNEQAKALLDTSINGKIKRLLEDEVDKES